MEENLITESEIPTQVAHPVSNYSHKSKIKYVILVHLLSTLLFSLYDPIYIVLTVSSMWIVVIAQIIDIFIYLNVYKYDQLMIHKLFINSTFILLMVFLLYITTIFNQIYLSLPLNNKLLVVDIPNNYGSFYKKMLSMGS